MHIPGGPPLRTCEDQIEYSLELIRAPALVDELDKLIEAVLNEGQKGTIGNNFRLYVTGYAKFFAVDDTYCDELNQVIQTAVNLNSRNGVRFIDIEQG